jgi:hypothetical protein
MWCREGRWYRKHGVKLQAADFGAANGKTYRRRWRTRCAADCTATSGRVAVVCCDGDGTKRAIPLSADGQRGRGKRAGGQAQVKEEAKGRRAKSNMPGRLSGDVVGWLVEEVRKCRDRRVVTDGGGADGGTRLAGLALRVSCGFVHGRLSPVSGQYCTSGALRKKGMVLILQPARGNK